MQALLAARIDGEIPDSLLLCEHEPVFTLGRSRNAAANLLDPGAAPVVEVERGGDVTFHGPGQLVGYPILALPPGRRDLHAYLRGLEEVLIEVLARLGITGARDPRNTGVWVEGRKIAAIGIAARKWVTWHGFALNVSVDLTWFQRMNPCGLDASLVTRLSEHCSPCPSLPDVRGETEAAFTDWWEQWSHPASSVR
jgi:lipoyl(octanoyl) transferase